jgi:hypothetical protein
MLAFDELRRYLAEIDIAHHIQGRIRLRMQSYPKDLLKGEHNPETLPAILERAAGIRSLRINPLARSCLVEYDPAVIPDQAWKDFIAGRHTSAAGKLEQILRDTYQEIINAKL